MTAFPLLTRCVLETDSEASYQSIISSSDFSITKLVSEGPAEISLDQAISFSQGMLRVVDLEPATTCTVGDCDTASFIIVPPRTPPSPSSGSVLDENPPLASFCDLVRVRVADNTEHRVCWGNQAFKELTEVEDEGLLSCGDAFSSTVIHCRITDTDGVEGSACLECPEGVFRNIRAAAADFDRCFTAPTTREFFLPADAFQRVYDGADLVSGESKSVGESLIIQSLELCPALDDFVLQRIFGELYMSVLSEALKLNSDFLDGMLLSPNDVVCIPLCGSGALRGVTEEVLLAVESSWDRLRHQHSIGIESWIREGVQSRQVPFRVVRVTSPSGEFGFLRCGKESAVSKVSLVGPVPANDDVTPLFPPHKSVHPFLRTTSVALQIKEVVHQYLNSLHSGFFLIHSFRENLPYAFIDTALQETGVLGLHVSPESMEEGDLHTLLSGVGSCSRHVAFIFHVTDSAFLDDPFVMGVLDSAAHTDGCTGALLFFVCESNDPPSPSLSSRSTQLLEAPNPRDEDREVFLRHLIEAQCERKGVRRSRYLNFGAMASWTVGFSFCDLLAYSEACFQQLGASLPGLPTGVEPILSESHCQSCLKSFIKAQGYNLVSTRLQPVRWSDVGGLEDAKRELKEAIQLPILYPELFSRQGVKKRTGILFYGPPGCGKTLLAKAVATEMNMNFMSVKGPELINQYVGESEKNIRSLFQRARDNAPCIVFFDELDALAPARGAKGDGGGAMDRIVAQLLVEVDGVGQTETSGKGGVFIIGATNRPDLLDPSLLRPGRFDRLCYLGLPATKKDQLFAVQALVRKFSLDKDVSLESVVEPLEFQYTGADFFALCSDAMMFAVNETLDQMKQNPDAQDADAKIVVKMEHFLRARDQLIPSVSKEDLFKYEALKQKF